MKILLVNKYHYLRGGAERAYFDTARVLREHGHEVAFFSMKHPLNEKTEWAKFFIEESDYQSESSIRRKVEMVKNVLWNRPAQKKLEDLLERFKPDVAHVHNIYHQLSPSIIATLKKRRIPVVMTLHDYKLVCPNYSMYVCGRIWEGGALRCIADRCVKDSFGKSVVCAAESILHRMMGIYDKVDAYIAPSTFLIEKFRERGFQKSIVHIPQPLFDRDRVQSVAFDMRRPIVFSGRISAEKGLETLLRALPFLPGEILYIAGSGPEEEKMKNLADELGIKDRVHFLGHLSAERLCEILCSAKAVVIPSVWYENMPYALLEALAAGKIVVASRIGGMAERIIDGENGFLFEAGNIRDLVSVFEGMSCKDMLQIQKKARESVSDLSPEKYYQEIRTVYGGISQK